MEVENIKGKRDYIDVYLVDGRVVRIMGELVHGGFIAFEDTIREWKVPDGEIVTEEEKQEIMDAVVDKTKGSHMVIEFE